MKRLHAQCAAAIVLAMTGTSLSAAPARPPKPTPPPKPARPAPPTNPTPGGDFIQCMISGNSIQVCLATSNGG